MDADLQLDTSRNEDGRYFSNLYSRSTNPSISRVVQLTRDPRFVDCHTATARQKDSTLVVFQSNRGSSDAVDISAFRLRDGVLTGGIQQLTRAGRFNEHPSFISEQTPVYFSSLEKFPDAQRRMPPGAVTDLPTMT